MPPLSQEKAKVESCSFDRNAANVFQSYVQVRGLAQHVCTAVVGACISCQQPCCALS